MELVLIALFECCSSVWFLHVSILFSLNLFVYIIAPIKRGYQENIFLIC